MVLRRLVFQVHRALQVAFQVVVVVLVSTIRLRVGEMVLIDSMQRASLLQVVVPQALAALQVASKVLLQVSSRQVVVASRVVHQDSVDDHDTELREAISLTA